jgi:hypothetical protein
MKVRQLNTTAAPVKWWAAMDAQRRNDENRLLYTPNQQSRAETLRDCAEVAFNKKCYVSYGKRRIVSIKVNGASRGNSSFEQLVSQYPNSEKVVTPQGITYRVDL